MSPAAVTIGVCTLSRSRSKRTHVAVTETMTSITTIDDADFTFTPPIVTQL